MNAAYYQEIDRFFEEMNTEKTKNSEMLLDYYNK